MYFIDPRGIFGETLLFGLKEYDYAKFLFGLSGYSKFDNMNIKNLKLGVKLTKKFYETEPSGNITLKNVKSVATTGVERISIGSITHSAPAIDFKLEV